VFSFYMILSVTCGTFGGGCTDVEGGDVCVECEDEHWELIGKAIFLQFRKLS
jgi:hypothetical protein